MDFSLTSFSDSFNSTVNRRLRNTFAFAFLLATTSDKGLFPDIINHYREIDELTAEYITVVSSKLLMHKAPNRPMNNHEVIQVLQSGEFYNHWNREYVNVTRDINKFLENQTVESIKFARFCGIEVDKIPCIVFFSALEEPKDYVLWELRGMDSHAVIGDLRSIVAKLEEEYKDIIQIKSRISSLNYRIIDFEYQLELRPRNYNSNINFYKNKIEPIEKRIIKWNKKLDSAIKTSQYEKETSRKRRCRKKVDNAHGELAEVRKKLEDSEIILKEYNDAGKAEIENNISVAKREIDEMNIKKSQAKIKPASQIIQSLDRKRFRLRIIKELGEAVPVFNLGLSGVKIFS